MLRKNLDQLLPLVAVDMEVILADLRMSHTAAHCPVAAPPRGAAHLAAAAFLAKVPLAATTLAAKVVTRKAITLRSPTNEAIPHLAATEMDTTAMAQAAKLGTATKRCCGSSRKLFSEVASEKKTKSRLPRCLVWFSSDPGKSQSEMKLLQPVDAEMLDSHGSWRSRRRAKRFSLSQTLALS